MLAALPDAEVGVIGLKRDETTHRPLAYLERLPDDLAGRHAYIVDPMLATGGSLATACDMLRGPGRGADHRAVPHRRARRRRAGAGSRP